jgi:hypothetical protein
MQRNDPKDVRPRRRRLGAIAFAGALAIVSSQAIPSAVSSDAGNRGANKLRPTMRRTYASDRFGYTGSIPLGWRRAPRRLVPNLLDPKEILSLGTFATLVGGGGNCQREPIAAIERMGTGDALITIQEEAESRVMKGRLKRNPPPPLSKVLSDLQLRRDLHAPREHVSPAEDLWHGQVSFTVAGRQFGALVFVKGPPRPRRVAQVHAILVAIHFDRGVFIRFPS